jgi:Leucine-rich repeat (LRR) protein
MASSSFNFESLSITKARSSRYPRTEGPDEEDWVNEPIYDKNEKWFDLGYQHLRKVPLHFKELSLLVKLFVDNNFLVELPEASALPGLIHLSCGHNELKCVPLYPKLIHLDCNTNKIRSLELYTGSSLTYLDCSSNKSIILPQKLKKLVHLYASECVLTTINFFQVPNLQYANLSQNNFSEMFSLKFALNLLELDISKSQIRKLSDESDAVLLRMLDISHNSLIKTPNAMPRLLDLNVSFNNLTIFDKEFPLLKKLTINNNELSMIAVGQSSLKKLTASYNKFTSVPKIGTLRYIDLNHNLLETCYVKAGLKYLYVEANPLKHDQPFIFAQGSELKLKEMCMSYPIYLSAKKLFPCAITSSHVIVDRKKIVPVFTKMLPGVEEDILFVILTGISKAFIETPLDEVPPMIKKLSSAVTSKLNLNPADSKVVEQNIVAVYKKISNVKLFFNNADENLGDEDRNIDALRTTTEARALTSIKKSGR